VISGRIARFRIRNDQRLIPAGFLLKLIFDSWL
jgi:hypothetical protein